MFALRDLAPRRTAPGALFVTIISSLCVLLFAAPAFADTLAAWNMNGTAGSAGKKADAGPSGLTLTEVGSPTSGTGTTSPTTDGAYVLNGSSQYLSAGDTDFVTGSSARTVEAWIKRTNDSGEDTIAEYGTFANDETWKLSILPGGIYGYKLHVDIYSTGCNSTSGISADSTWHYVAVTENGTSVQFYIDGVDAGSCTLAHTPNTVLSGTSYYGVNANGPSDYFHGSIDRVRISSGELSSATVGSHYLDEFTPTLALWNMNGAAGTSGKKADDGASGLTLTEVGSPTSGTGTTSPTTDGAYVLNGSSQYLSAGDTGFVTGNGSRTIEAWVKRTNDSGEDTIAEYGTFANDETWKLSILPGGIYNDLLHTDIYSTGCNSSSGVGADSLWHYVVATYDGSTVRYYIDGAAAGTCNLAHTPNTTLSGSSYIGVNANGPSDYFHGSIDREQYSSGVKSATAISDDYNSVVTP
jgi:Concanavalin A-like lectin/glucanases superfamily